MKFDIITLVLLLVYGVFYLFFFAKIQNRFFGHLGNPKKNHAVLILYISSLISASINLVHIAEVANNAIEFFLNNGDYIKTILFVSGFFVGMWIFSIVLFRFSFLIVGFLSKEKEEDELLKNNIELALVHSIVIITLSFLISPALVNIASELIPYPKLPF